MYLFKGLFIAAIFVLAVVVYGNVHSDIRMDKIGKLHSLKAYQDESAEQTAANSKRGDALLAELTRNLDKIEVPSLGGLHFNQNTGNYEEAVSLRPYVSSAIQAALEKKDYKLLIEILAVMESDSGRFVRYDIPNSMNDRLHQVLFDISATEGKWNNKGVLALVDVIGWRMVSEKEYLRAYYFFANAALSLDGLKKYNSDMVIELLTHFGCAQDILVWNEFSIGAPITKYRDYPSAQYPSVKMDDDFNVGLARKALDESRVAPELQKICPINLYSSL